VVEGARLESVYAGNRIAGSNPAPSASYYVLDIAYIIVFLGSLFSREFAGVTGLAFEAICGRDGCTRDFGRSRYENLSGAISWLTFFAGGAADVRRCRSDWRRELAESTICSQRKPRSCRCSAQPTGSRGVRRINVLAVSCGGFRPLMMAVVMSGASQGRRKRALSHYQIEHVTGLFGLGFSKSAHLCSFPGNVMVSKNSVQRLVRLCPR
jgi:hypothetical protein